MVPRIQIGRHLPLITRAVMRAVFDLPYNPETLKLEGGDYNIVQNNGISPRPDIFPSITPFLSSYSGFPP